MEHAKIFCSNLDSIFVMFCVTKNILIIVFKNDEDLFDRFIIAFILFVAIRNYCFFFDVPLLSFLGIDTFPKKSVGNVYLHFFHFTRRINCYCCQTNAVFSGCFFACVGFAIIGFYFSAQIFFTINWFFIKMFSCDVSVCLLRWCKI